MHSQSRTRKATPLGQGRHHLVDRATACGTSEEATPPAVQGSPDTASQNEGLLASQNSRGKLSFLPTTCLQLRPRSPPSARDRSCPRALGKSFLCVCALAGRCCLLCLARLTPTLRRGPAGCPRKKTSLPAFFHPWRRVRGPNPGLARKCSWRPKGSRMQGRTERGKGRRRRRRNNPEWFRVYSRDAVNWQCCQRHGIERATMFGGVQTGPQNCPAIVLMNGGRRHFLPPMLGLCRVSFAWPLVVFPLGNDFGSVLATFPRCRASGITMLGRHFWTDT